MSAIVHRHGGRVEKSDRVVFSQLALNKHWLPDDMINEIKDYLYINAAEVLRKFYRAHVNRSITDMNLTNHTLVDIYGRSRMVVWHTGYIYGGGVLNLQGAICVTCGDCWQLHNNANNCCALEWDIEDEHLQLVELEIDEEADEDEDEEIPEVSWDIDIPVASYDFQQAQAVLNALQQAEAEVARQQIEDAVWGRQPEEQYNYDEDMESQMADYAEYQREVDMEAYSDRYGR